MKILHIITGLNNGGAEAVLYRLCTADHLHQHHVVSMMDGGKYGPLLQESGIPVTCLHMSRGKISLSSLLYLWRLLRSERWDVVQTWMYHADFIGGVLSRLAGVQRIFWGIHNTTLARGKSRRATIAVARVNAVLSRWVPAGIVCCAESSRQVHSSLGYLKNKMRVIPNGYDLSRFRPDQKAAQRLRDEWGIGKDIPLLGMVGRFDPQKDHENLLKALSLLKRRGHIVHCALIGPGLDATNAQLERWLQLYGLVEEVLLLGQRDDIPAVMNTLDLHILSSGFGEAFPNVLSEAMACGTPCVSTDVGDAALIIGKTGWVVPANDFTSLAEAVSLALVEWKDSEQWSLRQRAARQRVMEHFSVEQMVAAYREVWTSFAEVSVSQAQNATSGICDE